ncbi:hypothetical protein HNR46_000091 [Haloferula luteola]|uniref:Uncharacterized protein n=1 Tax=Haloferula luteola TaxID=595692 RepID=A0A840V7D7_9BACT|nr:hypothetical protein [Haloferula luteola]MBB5349870.1 hypothetical protein [Haloferula luteola]
MICHATLNVASVHLSAPTRGEREQWVKLAVATWCRSSAFAECFSEYWGTVPGVEFTLSGAHCHLTLLVRKRLTSSQLELLKSAWGLGHIGLQYPTTKKGGRRAS